MSSRTSGRPVVRTDETVGLRGEEVSGPTLCFICAPSLGILDNWLPVLWQLRKQQPNASLVCILPKARSVGEIDLSNVLIQLAGQLFDRVLFRSHAGNWLVTATLQDAVRLTRLRTGEALVHRVAGRLRGGRLASSASHALRSGLRLLERLTGPRSSSVVHPQAVLASVGAVLYDVAEEGKNYNAEVLQPLDAVPRFSVSHGIDVKAHTRPARPPRDGHLRKHVTAYLFSALESGLYRDGLGVDESALKVMGILRHEADWVRTIMEQSAAAAAELGEGFLLVISKPINKRYLFRERKRQAFEDIRQLAVELGRRVIIKRHPKEHADGLCEEVFGHASYGEAWAYSNLHPFVLGTKCLFAVSFASFVVLDLIAVGTPVIERLDLRGIPPYDGPNALRDGSGEPVLSLRYWGLVRGASEFGQLRRHAFDILDDPEGVANQQASRYRELFPRVEHGAASIARDVLASIGEQVGTTDADSKLRGRRAEAR